MRTARESRLCVDAPPTLTFHPRTLHVRHRDIGQRRQDIT